MAKLITPTDDQKANFQAWRTQALAQMPYMASMLFSLRVLNAPGLETFAVDDHHRLYIDFDACTPRGARWCAEALLHECGHLFGKHAERAELAAVRPDEKMMSNIAADAEINDDLRDAGCDMSDAVLPSNIECDDYQTFEHYLAALRKQGQGQPQDSGDGSDGAAEGDGSGQPSDAGSGDGESGDDSGSSNDPHIGCGSGSGGEAAPCELPSDDDFGGNAPAASNTEKNHVLVATAASIQDHVAKNRGSVPAGMAQQAEFLLRPSKVPWRQVLASTIRRAVATQTGTMDVTYTRRNRRHASSEFFHPGPISPKPNVVVVRDTSGSMGHADLERVGSEVEAISKKMGVRGRDLRVIDVDAQAHEAVDYTDRRILFEIKGRGGTDMRVGIDAAMKLRPRPTAIIVATDGYTPWPDEKLRVPVVACIVGPSAESAAENTPDWMPTVVVDD